MLRPLPAHKWTFTTAAHLLNRAGFGGTPVEIEKLLKQGLDDAVALLVDYEKVPEPTLDPEWAKPDPDRMEKGREMRDMQRQAREAQGEERQKLEARLREMRQMEQREQRQRLIELRGWWLRRMASGPRPLQEKLALFWHGHFATSFLKVRDPYLMWLQNDTFRKHASGNWLNLLVAVTRDPAMLIWLDQTQSRKDHPNENYAREVMELFALGEGNYTEKDVTEAARALTGLTLDRVRQVGDYRPAQHDSGVKTVLGKTAQLDWRDVLELIVAHPQAPRFICRKLWTFFAKENPSDELVDALAAVFRKSGNNFKPLLRAMFTSEEFYAEPVIRGQVKSPVQWLVSSVRMLERDLPPLPFTSNLLMNLGQELFAPPNVKGWDGGVAWITTNNLLARYNYAEMLVLGTVKFNFNADRPAAQRVQDRVNRFPRDAKPLDVTRLLSAEERRGKDTLIAALEKRLIQGKLKPKQEQALRDYLNSQGAIDDRDILETVRLIMSTPEFQLC